MHENVVLGNLEVSQASSATSSGHAHISSAGLIPANAATATTSVDIRGSSGNGDMKPWRSPRATACDDCGAQDGLSTLYEFDGPYWKNL